MITLTGEYIRSLNSREDRRLESADRAADREAEVKARQDVRVQALADEQRSFQRDTLLELQEQLSDFLRLGGEAVHHDRQAWRAAGEPDHYPVSLLPEGVSDGYNVLQRRIQILTQRVNDDELRAMVTLFVDLSTASTNAKSMVDADRFETECVLQFRSTNECIGSLLRMRPTSGELPT